MKDSAGATSAGLSGQLARNTALSYAGRLAYIAGWMLLTPWMLHRLGPERFGLWSLMSVVSGLYVTFDLGLLNALAKFVAEFRAAGEATRLRGTITVAAILYTALSAAWTLLIVFAREPLLHFFSIAPGVLPEARAAILAAGLTYASINASMLAAALLTGLHRLDLWNLISIVATVLQIAFSAFVLQHGGGVRALVLVNGAATLLGAVLAAIAARRLAPELGFDLRAIDRDLWKRLTHFSFALQIINLGLLAMFQLDKVLFGRMVGLADVGQFELGSRVAFSVWSVPALLLPPLLPAIAHLDAMGDRASITRLYRRATRYVLSVALPLAAGLVVLSPALYRAWLGPGQEQAALAAGALGVALAVNILTGVGSAIVRGVGRPGIEAEYFVLATVLHVPLSLWLIPRYGFSGGLVALVASCVVGSLWFVARFHRYFNEPLLPFLAQVVLPPAVVAAIAGAVAGWVGGQLEHVWPGASRAHAILVFGGGGLVLVSLALGLLLLVRYLQPAELRELAALVTRRRAPAGGVA
jgi:O-antigen/teichoic acid export membrane protein